MAEKIYADKVNGTLVTVETKPANVSSARDGEYSNRRGIKALCATVSAGSKNQIRKWCIQNGMKPQAYKGDKGAWTADCRQPLPKEKVEEPSEEKGLAIEKDRRRSRKSAA